jgi:hypothetical protein
LVYFYFCVIIYFLFMRKQEIPTSIIDWRSASQPIPIEGSDYIGLGADGLGGAPGSVDQLNQFLAVVGEPDEFMGYSGEELILKLVGGRHQNLRRINYNEGALAAVVPYDTKTGRIADQPGAENRLVSGDNDNYDSANVLEFRPIALDNGLSLRWLQMTNGIPVTQIFPGFMTLSNEGNSVSISPANQLVKLKAMGLTSTIGDIATQLKYSQGFGFRETILRYQDTEAEVNPGFVEVTLGNYDQVTSVKAQKGDFLERLEIEGVEFQVELDAVEMFQDEFRKQRVLDGIARILGADKWSGIEVNTSADRILNRMGRRPSDATGQLGKLGRTTIDTAKHPNAGADRVGNMSVKPFDPMALVVPR